MKKFIFIILILFSLGQEKVSLAFFGSDFSEEALNDTIEEYVQFFNDMTQSPEAVGVPPQEEKKEPTPEELAQAKADAVVKQMIVMRRAQALAATILEIGNEAYNLFLLHLMKYYLEEEKNRVPLKLLIDEIIHAVQPEMDAIENHRVWKSAIEGGAGGFYVLATLEVLNAVGKKTKGFERLFNLLKKVQGAGAAAPAVISEATDIAIRGATSRGWFLKRVSLFTISTHQLEKWVGKAGRPRMGRFVAIGILWGLLSDAYSYHWTEQKLNPKVFFEVIQALAILDLAARVLEFRDSFDFSSGDAPIDQMLEFLQAHQASQKLLEEELDYFKTAAPQFLANMSLVQGENSESQEMPLAIFLNSFYETYPRVKRLFEPTSSCQRLSSSLEEDQRFQEVSCVSLSPIELQLQQATIELNRFGEKIMQKALSPR